MVTEKEESALSGKDTALCSSCQMLVVWIQNQLKQKSTKERVFSYVNQLCESLPSPNGESVVDCNSISQLPNISFTIGAKPFILTPEQYILKTGEGIAEVCLSGFIAFDIPPPRGPLWINSIALDLINTLSAIFNFGDSFAAFGQAGPPAGESSSTTLLVTTLMAVLLLKGKDSSETQQLPHTSSDQLKL